MYTGFPDCATFIAWENFVDPRPGFSRNYYSSYTNASKDPSYIVSRGTQEICVKFNELFITLSRLLLDLLDRDLADSGSTFYNMKYITDFSYLDRNVCVIIWDSLVI